MSHPYFQQMRQQIIQELKQQLEERYAGELARREKELLIKLKQKEDREFADMEEMFRPGSSEGVQELKARVEAARVELARLRSDNNVKVKRIQAEAKQYEDKIMKDSVNYQKILQGLQQQLKQLEQMPRQQDLQMTASYRNFEEQQEEEPEEEQE
jgi:hypothetical protein